MELDKDFNLTIGLRIREIREAYRMTLAEFSERCDLSESFLTAVEGGRKGITSKTLYKICSTMNVSADYIVFGRDKGFEADAVIEILNTLDEHSREGAVRILREYADSIYHIQKQHNKECKKSECKSPR